MAILTVGPNEQYATLSAAVAASPGDEDPVTVTSDRPAEGPVAQAFAAAQAEAAAARAEEAAADAEAAASEEPTAVEEEPTAVEEEPTPADDEEPTAVTSDEPVEGADD